MIYPLLVLLLQLILIVLLAPLVNGIIKKIKALSQHRKGMSVFQLYFDLIKLFKKDVIIPKNASWIFVATPYICLISMLTASLFVPILPKAPSFGLLGDGILFISLLAVGRFFMALSGLDTGSTFGGMGSSREMMIAFLIEPSLMVTIFTLGLSAKAGSTNLKSIFTASESLGLGVIHPVYILLFASTFIILIAETARIPVDDPATHLELTMVHEAMLLEYSGRYLALMELSSSMKQLLFITILVNTFLPFGTGLTFGVGILLTLLLYFIKVVVVAGLIGLFEINVVKLRLFSVPNLAALSFILALLGFMAGFIYGR